MPNEIQIDYPIYSKMFAYAEIAKKTFDSEVGGYLIIDELEGGGLKVEDIILPKQTVSGATFTTKPGLKVDPSVIPKIRGFWHSHHNMGTFHSSTDDTTLGDKWNGETHGSAPYAVSIVVAFPNKIIAYVQYFKPILLEKLEIPVVVLHPPDVTGLYEKCEAEVKAQVSKEVYNQNWKWMGGDYEELPSPKDTGDASSPTTDEEMKAVTEKFLLDEACDAIIDPTTGMSVTELKVHGMWNPTKYDHDLAVQVKQMVELLREKYRKPTDEEKLKFGQCVHICLNQQNKPICFIQGKNYDCSKCQRNPKNKKTEEKKMCDPLNLSTGCPANPEMKGQCHTCNLNIYMYEQPKTTVAEPSSEVVQPIEASQPSS
jgi:hypothetical protein